MMTKKKKKQKQLSADAASMYYNIIGSKQLTSRTKEENEEKEAFED